MHKINPTRAYKAGHLAACTHGQARPGRRVKGYLAAYLNGFKDGLHYKKALNTAISLGFFKAHP